MNSTVQQLVTLLYQAVPTAIFLVFLTFYLRQVFFVPMGKVLEERRRATEGTRELADRAFAAADQKTSEFERALQAARFQLNQEQEAQRKSWLAEQSDVLTKTRSRAEHRLQQTRLEIANDSEQASQDLVSTAQSLAATIIHSLVRKKAA